MIRTEFWTSGTNNANDGFIYKDFNVFYTGSAVFSPTSTSYG